MATSIQELKQNRKLYDERLLNEVVKATSSAQGEADARFWQPTTDKAGNGFAIIRFLPAPKGEDVPFIKLFSHNFKGPKNAWYIENCLSTIGQPDPVNEFNSELWNTGLQKNQDQVRKQKRKLTFISNILVIKDKEKPENEGKVFLYRYGKKIFDKIQDQLKPAFEDESPINVFDFWHGANLKLKIVTKDDFRNYDASAFEAPTPLGDDDFIETIWKQQHSLQEWVAPAQFKSYDELKKKLYQVLDLNNNAPVASRVNRSLAEEMDDEIPFAGHREAVADDDDADLAKIRALVDDDD
jgi:hypothetical protein